MGKSIRSLLCAGFAAILLLGSFLGVPVYAGNESQNNNTTGDMEIWIQNSAERAFESSTPPETIQKFIALYAARNEYESAQILVRSGKALQNLTVAASDLVGNGSRIAASNIQVFAEQSVPASVSGDIEVPPDGSNLYTDTLIPAEPLDIAADTTQPFWLRVYIPKAQQPGIYSGKVTVTAAGEAEEIPVSVRVYDVTLPDTDNQHFKMNNWFASVESDFGWLQNSVLSQYNVELYDENWWKVMSSFAKDLSIHRNNVIYLDVCALLMQNSRTLTDEEKLQRQEFVTDDADRMAAGQYLFDWNNFDRMINLFIDAGAMQYLYLTGNALKESGGSINLMVLEEQNGMMGRKAVSVFTDAQMESVNPEAQEWIQVFFRALRSHISEKYPQFLDKVYVSALDEPKTEIQNKGSDWYYSAVRQVYPETKSIEAHSRFTTGMTQSTALCPVLDVYDNYQSYYQEQLNSGKELWCYTCIVPKREYLNRFIPFHLIKTRWLPWYMYKIGATGYLHWGYSYWGKNDTFSSLQSGDEWLVRPDADKFDVFTSVRNEAQLDGIEDYELLTLLSQKNTEAARRIVNTVIQSATKYTKDGTAAMQAHKAVLDLLTGGDADPIAMLIFEDDFSNGYDYAWNRYTLQNTKWRVLPDVYQYNGAATTNLGMTTLRNQVIKDGKISVTIQMNETYGGQDNMWAGITFRKGNQEHNSFDSGYTVALQKNGKLLIFRTPNWKTIAENIPVNFDENGKVRLNISMNGSKFVVSQGTEEKVLCEFEDDAISEGYISLVGDGVNADFSDFRLYSYDGTEEAKTSSELIRDQSYSSNFKEDSGEWRIEGEGAVQGDALVLGRNAQAGLEGRIFTQCEINAVIDPVEVHTNEDPDDSWCGFTVGKETVYGDAADYGGYLVKIYRSGRVSLEDATGVIQTADTGTAMTEQTSVRLIREEQKIRVAIDGTEYLNADTPGYKEGFVSISSSRGTMKVDSFSVTRNLEEENQELLDDFSRDLSGWTKVKEPDRIDIKDGTLQIRGVITRQDSQKEIAGKGTSPELLYTARTFQNVRIGFDVKLNDTALAENWAGAYFHSTGTSGFWTSGGYLLFLTNTQSLVIFKGGSNTEIASAQIKEDPTKEPVHLEMEIVDGRLNVYVNYAKAPTLTAEDTAFTSGYFGLCADWTDADFDNVTCVDLGPCSIEEPAQEVVWDQAFSDDFDTEKEEWALLDSSSGKMQYEAGKMELDGISANNPVTVALRGNAYTSAAVSLSMTIPSKEEGWAGFGIGRGSWNSSVWAEGYYVLAMYNKASGKAEIRLYNPTYGYIGAEDVDYEKGTFLKFRMEVSGKTICVYAGDEEQPGIQAYASDYNGGFVALCNYAAKNLYDDFQVSPLTDLTVWDEDYTDDFSKETGNWISSDSVSGSFSISAGKLNADGTNGADPEQVVLKNHAYHDLNLAASLSLPDAASGWAALSFGKASQYDRIWDSGYFITAAEDMDSDVIRLWKAKETAGGDISLLGETRVPKTDDRFLNLRVLVKKGKVLVFAGANDEAVIECEIPQYSGGFVAICSYMAQVECDDFNIAKPEDTEESLIWDAMYSDDFTSDTGCWTNADPTAGGFSISEGKLNAAGNSGANPVQAVLKNRAYHDMEIAADFTLPDAATGWTGICFGKVNTKDRIWDSGFFATAAKNNQTGKAEIRLWKAQADSAGNIGLIGEAAVEQTGECLRLTVQIKGHDAKIFVNESREPVITGNLDSYEGGQIALITYMAQNRFDSVTIKAPESEAVKAESVSLDITERTLEKGGTITLKPTVSPENAETNLVWQSSDPKVATVINGVVTAVGKGNAHITVRDERSGCETSCDIQVNVQISGIQISTESLLLETGKSAQLQAVVVPSDASDQRIIWSTSDEKVAVVDDSGNVLAVSPGTAEIRAAAGDGEFVSTCTITVLKENVSTVSEPAQNTTVPVTTSSEEKFTETEKSTTTRQQKTDESQSQTLTAASSEEPVTIWTEPSQTPLQPSAPVQPSPQLSAPAQSSSQPSAPDQSSGQQLLQPGPSSQLSSGSAGDLPEAAAEETGGTESTEELTELLNIPETTTIQESTSKSMTSQRTTAVTRYSESANPTAESPDETSGGKGFPWWIFMIAAAAVAAVTASVKIRRDK